MRRATPVSLLLVTACVFGACRTPMEGLEDAAVVDGGPAASDAGRADGSRTDASASSSSGGNLDASHVDAAPTDAGHAIPDAATPDANRADAAQAADAANIPSPDASIPFDDAEVVLAEFPSSLACAAASQARVVMRNTGNTTWTRAGGYKLGALDDMDPFYGPDTRVWIPEGASVAPGDTHEFLVEMQAPPTPGPQVTDWRMVLEGVHWFGAQTSHTVGVECAAPVDATTMSGKLMMGYQGWFACPGDGSALDRWNHYFRGGTASVDELTIDYWPDTSDLPAEEQCTTGFVRPDGSPAPLYSPARTTSVVRHFQWMEENGIDGVYLQRFTSELSSPPHLAWRDQVTQNVMAGAAAHGRVFALMYDISGQDGSTMVALLKSDWAHLVNDLGVTTSPGYLHHGGRPVLAVWGLGFNDRPGTPAQAAEIIAHFKNSAPSAELVTLIGGVPTHWRALTGDSHSDPAWGAVYRSYDIISPWAVGRYADNSGADAFKNDLIVPDLAEASQAGREYMPVIWPGFSWHNLLAGPLNQIPRNGGRFWWRQFYNVASAGCTMVFGAMFDEVDEGTAMFKLAPTSNELPVGASLVPLNADGESLPADWYLRIAGEATRVLRGERALTASIPITP